MEIMKGLKKEIFINMEEQVLVGNVLDIGNDNYGIVYSLYKRYNEDAALEYVNGKKESKLLEEGTYDTCIMLFSFSSLAFKLNRRSLLKTIGSFLKEQGIIHIWDIDKGYGRIFNGEIKILLPDRKIKKIRLTDFNIFKNVSVKVSLDIIKEEFDILNLVHSDSIYYVKGKKKGKEEYEGTASRDKL